MNLNLCQVVLKKVRAYRDCAEVLLLVRPKDQSPEKPKDQGFKQWGLNLTSLSPKERSSLRVLSPQQRLLHIEWCNTTILDRTVAALNETEPVKPLSLPPPKRLSSDYSVVDELEEQWEILSSDIRQSTNKVIDQEKNFYTSYKPSSIEEIKRTLAITDTLTALNSRWQLKAEQSEETSKKSLLNSSSSIETDKYKETLCLYFQDTGSKVIEHGSPLPKSLNGGWIDSIPPIEIPSEDVDEKNTNQQSPVLWLRLLLDSSFWTPQVRFSIHGDMGRLSVFAKLELSGLAHLITPFIDGDDEHNQEVTIEWINDFYHGNIAILSESIQTRESVFPTQQLLTTKDNEQPSICFSSITFMSRSLRDLDSERDLILNADKQRLQQAQQFDAINSDQASKFSLGYFCSYIHFKYPLSLNLEDDQITKGIHSIKLCLPTVETFLSQLIFTELEDGSLPWELIYEGEKLDKKPKKDRHGMIRFSLGETTDIVVNQHEKGLQFTSTLPYLSRVGILSIDGSELLDEIELQPLGNGVVKHLQQALVAEPSL